MRTAWPARLVAVAATLLSQPLVAAAQTRGPTIIVLPDGQPVLPALPFGYAQPLACWSDVRIFRTLRNGNFPYCRQNLRYRPGALECYQITEQVCEVLPAGATLPIQTTSQINKQVIVCPDGPEPPVCRRLDIQ
ncbi:MAG TPA: hypothetical protein VNO26_10040 [Candidatus Limnocylindria bacterium]|nr:hypothetical protein [Candidatus Limnocylindria bacterium]